MYQYFIHVCASINPPHTCACMYCISCDFSFQFGYNDYGCYFSARRFRSCEAISVPVRLTFDGLSSWLLPARSRFAGFSLCFRRRMRQRAYNAMVYFTTLWNPGDSVWGSQTIGFYKSSLLLKCPADLRVSHLFCEGGGVSPLTRPHPPWQRWHTFHRAVGPPRSAGAVTGARPLCDTLKPTHNATALSLGETFFPSSSTDRSSGLLLVWKSQR